MSTPWPAWRMAARRRFCTSFEVTFRCAVGCSAGGGGGRCAAGCSAGRRGRFCRRLVALRARRFGSFMAFGPPPARGLRERICSKGSTLAGEAGCPAGMAAFLRTAFGPPPARGLRERICSKGSTLAGEAGCPAGMAAFLRTAFGPPPARAGGQGRGCAPP